MKLQGFVLPALAGIATATAADNAASRPAEAYIIRQAPVIDRNPPSIPDELAHAILLQRLSSSENPSVLGQLPEALSQEKAISYIEQFGKPSRPLFQNTDANEQNQLVIAFSGVTAERYEELTAAVDQERLAFKAPALSQMPIRGNKKCAFGSAIDPASAQCWNGKTQYLHFDVAKDNEMIDQLTKNFGFLVDQALEGKMETTILFLDPSSPDSEELRRRDLGSLKEQVISEEKGTKSPSELGATADASDKTDKPFHAFAEKPTVIPTCFTSHNACVTTTNECSGHGECVDRWIESEESCFFCHCKMTHEPGKKGNQGGTYNWGGSMCQKQDVSTPFWMFAGVTLALVGTVAFSIGLLFSVGEEKLPGVIGAGVSRAK